MECGVERFPHFRPGLLCALSIKSDLFYLLSLKFVRYIELFAGCGGLSLGLQSVGFQLTLANELSPMAAESYAFNFFNEDLNAQAKQPTPKPKYTVWLGSRFPLSDLKNRLREDPRQIPTDDTACGDIAPDGSNLAGSLVVGSIVELNKLLTKKPAIAAQIKNSFGAGGVDLVSGGPPCQSFSMAGLRQLESEKNSLPWEFARFAEAIRPKFVLLENVTGILRPFKDSNGQRFYAWFELAKAFATIGYVPLCLHLNAKYAGVPQNRPRFILLGLRADIFNALEPTFNAAELALFEKSLTFFRKASAEQDLALVDLPCFDVAKPTDRKLFQSSFLNTVVTHTDGYVTVSDAIDDLRLNTPPSPFVDQLRQTFASVLTERPLRNHELRANTPLVKRRFRLYQVLQRVDKDTRERVLSVLKQEAHDLSDADWSRLSAFDYLLENGAFARFANKQEFLSFLHRHPTKKQTQKALLADQPAPAALSIPDDACHYHHDEQRTLTVREMARIQSFPDHFEFRSKTTTGGQMRQFEVPQYTQVGNAVPPLLGRALGLAISELLARLVVPQTSLCARPATGFFELCPSCCAGTP